MSVQNQALFHAILHGKQQNENKETQEFEGVHLGETVFAIEAEENLTAEIHEK